MKKLIFRRGPAHGKEIAAPDDFFAIRGDIYIVPVPTRQRGHLEPAYEKVYYKCCGKIDEDTFVYTPDGYL